MLKIAISQKPEFAQEVINQLFDVGIEIGTDTCQSEDVFVSKVFPAEIRYLSANQIINYIACGVQDLGIVKEHILLEKPREIESVYTFKHTESSLSIFIPNAMSYKNLKSLAGKKIATDVPNIVTNFFNKNKIRLSVVFDESPEYAVKLGAADCFVDFSSTDINQFTVIETIMQSSTVIVANKEPSAQKRVFIEEFIDRLMSLQNVKHKVQVQIFCDPSNQSKIISTVIKIDNDLVAISGYNRKKMIIQAIIDERQLWDIKNYLKEVGAEKIVIQNINKIIQ